MSSGAGRPVQLPRHHRGTARALRVLVNLGRLQLDARGAVVDDTWQAIDVLLDELIESLPTSARPGVR